MRMLKSAGDCPQCNSELLMYKSKSYKRFIKCDNDECEFGYGIPKSGKIEFSGELCPEKKLPILIVTKKIQKVTYFWVDGPCFTCRKGTSCPPIADLREEYQIKSVNY